MERFKVRLPAVGRVGCVRVNSATDLFFKGGQAVRTCLTLLFLFVVFSCTQQLSETVPGIVGGESPRLIPGVGG
ncbi:hypothetical protein [Cyclobacterium sp. SYSU L10401]|uniref:hypothetical protein n=1 Tax=Cyclobacterium sp. SYSU L10401 TaxID=2678657 RepID=UPI0013D22A75|nr:hypothetical protein [Cyclobacterium sp. SYSU L10401]